MPSLLNNLGTLYRQRIEGRYYPEELKDPFFIIVHKSCGENNPEGSGHRKTLDELEDIMRNYDYTLVEGDPKVIPCKEILHLYRPILVVGFYRGFCVDEQRNALRRNGFEAYISPYGSTC